jgi:hypothetical protein
MNEAVNEGVVNKAGPFLYTFVLNKMCDIIASGVRTDMGYSVLS